VQKIVKAYERWQEVIGASRQLTLKLGEPSGAERQREPESESESSLAPTT
jgi:hypothetical protein